MAGDWIKVEKATARKPEVLRIAVALGIHPDQAFGLCIRFWSWCDDQLETGNAPGVTGALLDALLERDGIATALALVGWIKVENGELVIPNYDRHLSENAKKRALTARRAAKRRSRKGNAESVTVALPREEKRREEIDTPIGVSRANTKFVKPTVEEVSAYCLERKNSVDPERFFAHYESNGWRVGKNPMKDWRGAVRTWEKSEFQKPAKAEPLSGIKSWMEKHGVENDEI